MYMCMHMVVCVCHSTYVAVTRQLSEVAPLLSLLRVNSGHWVCTSLSPTESGDQPSPILPPCATYVRKE